MMRDIGACFYYAHRGYNEGNENSLIEKPVGGLPMNLIKTVADYTVDLSSVVVQGINCFFNGLIIYIQHKTYLYEKTITA